MHHRLQPRQNLQILLLVKILALFDLRRLRLSLLLRLTNLDPLLHGKVLTDFGKGIFRETKFGEDGAVDWGQGDVVVGSVWEGGLVWEIRGGMGEDKPGEIQHSQPIHMCLVLWWCADTMHTTLHIPRRQRSQCITGINRNRRILRLNPLPLSLIVQDLQCRNRLSEQQRHRA